MVVTAHAGVYKLNDDFLTDVLEIPVAPLLERECRRLSPAFIHRALVGAARRVRLNLIRRAELDIHLPAIGLPARDAGWEVLVGIRHTTVVFFFELILYGIWGRVAALPKRLNELVALFVIGELLEGGALFVGDNPPDVFVHPFLISLA